MKRLIILLAFLAILCSVAIAGALSEKKDIPVRFAYQKMACYYVYFIAQEKGYFKEEGLEIEPIIATSQNAVDAMLAGQIDVAQPSTPLALAVEYAAPGRIKIIALDGSTSASDTETQRIIVKSDSNMTSLADLEGKRIAISANRFNAVVLKIILSKFFDPSSVTFVSLPFEEHITALQNGGVDAASAIEPIATAAIISGGFRDLDSSYSRAKYIVDPYYSSSYVVSSEFIKKYPEGAKKLQCAFAKAIKFMSENDAESRTIIGKYTGYPPEITQKMHITRDCIPTEADLPTLRKLVDILLENGFLKGRVDPYNLILW